MEGKQALGIIETRGSVALITAVDSALKAANVSLESRCLVGGGLVNATVAGDVGAVKAAMDAARAQIDRMNASGRTWVIPRPAGDVWGMLAEDRLSGSPPRSAPPVVRPQAEPPAIRPEPEVPALRPEPGLPMLKSDPAPRPPRKPKKTGSKK